MTLNFSGCKTASVGTAVREMEGDTPARYSKEMTEDVRQLLLQKLRTAPAWTQIAQDDDTPDDLKMRNNLLQLCAEIAQYRVLDIRLLLAEFIQASTGIPPGIDLDQMSKLFVLNRYLFNAPSKISLRKGRSFGGWRVPYDDRTGDMRWPFTRVRGKLELTGNFRGYLGERYDALGEFDYFMEKFGLRDERDFNPKPSSRS